MKLLKDRIRRDGKYLGNGILKVDRFINHQVDPMLMDACGAEFARLFKDLPVNKILTAEISGIAPALMTGKYLNLPVVYARKTKPVTMPPTVYITVAPSHTKGNNVELIVSPEYLERGDQVLIIDDFLASGATMAGLVRLAEVAGAQVLGIGTLIEKTFEGGRALLQALDIPIHSLVSISRLDEDGIEFTDEFEN
ncbi:MAG TPA: xanthine phosphoribosyltransferase [Anaerolineaceae bacterium]|nr:xanthine phosphoribosyltransferase [Anaerolineaceae bacterium]